MSKNKTTNHRRENELRKKEIEKENEFLKEEVMGRGVLDSTGVSKQNIQSNIERSIESSD